MPTRRGIYKLSDLKEFNIENAFNKEIYLNTLAYNLLKDDSIIEEEMNKDNFERIKKSLNKEKEELAVHFYERAVYHAVIKNNPKEALRLYFKAKYFNSSPEKYEEKFKLEIKDSECFQIILNGLNNGNRVKMSLP